jgi:transcriptional regulator with XRE-family HTH domain
MKERLIQLLDLEQLSPSKFADIIGVQRSSISHVISGRNKPSFDFLQKTLKAFPGLNASWLMLGEGTMYEQMGRNVSGNLFGDQGDESGLPVAEQDSLQHDETVREAPVSSGGTGSGGELTESRRKSSGNEAGSEGPALNGGDAAHRDEIKSPVQKRIVQVMVLYDDDTFRTFTPSE